MSWLVTAASFVMIHYQLPLFAMENIAKILTFLRWSELVVTIGLFIVMSPTKQETFNNYYKLLIKITGVFWTSDASQDSGVLFAFLLHSGQNSSDTLPLWTWTHTPALFSSSPFTSISILLFLVLSSHKFTPFLPAGTHFRLLFLPISPWSFFKTLQLIEIPGMLATLLKILANSLWFAITPFK